MAQVSKAHALPVRALFSPRRTTVLSLSRRVRCFRAGLRNKPETSSLTPLLLRPVLCRRSSLAAVCNIGSIRRWSSGRYHASLPAKRSQALSIALNSFVCHCWCWLHVTCRPLHFIAPVRPTDTSCVFCSHVVAEGFLPPLPPYIPQRHACSSPPATPI